MPWIPGRLQRGGWRWNADRVVRPSAHTWVDEHGQAHEAVLEGWWDPETSTVRPVEIEGYWTGTSTRSMESLPG